MNPWLVVPTLGNRDASLIPLLRDAGMPSVMIHTDSGDDIDRGERWTVTVEGSMNIQRWWNFGIQRAVKDGADVVVICNDDVAAQPGALVELAAHIEPGEPGSPMLVWPHDPEHAKGRVTPITGYCFALDPARIRPDETFSWWWGDNDLELRARAMRPDGGALPVRNPGIKHLRQGHAYDRDVRALIDVDRAVFTRRYPDLMGGWS